MDTFEYKYDDFMLSLIAAAKLIIAGTSALSLIALTLSMGLAMHRVITFLPTCPVVAVFAGYS